MVNSEENMTNLNNDEKRVTVRDSRTLTRENVSIVMDTREVTEKKPLRDIIKYAHNTRPALKYFK